MQQVASGQEIETKLCVPDVSVLQRRLKRLRAREISPRTHESNTLYDTPGKDLTCRGELIRIRIEQPGTVGGRSRSAQDATAILTYKGPSHRSRGLKKATREPKASKRFKIRDEMEVRLDGWEQMTAILRALGLRPVFRYEKFRTTYALPSIRNVKVEFDETPVGLFLELEGDEAAIDRAARLLGYSQSDYITQTYGALYIADCRRRGIKPGDMLFPPTRKLR